MAGLVFRNKADAPMFPLRAHTSGRYLIDVTTMPFPMFGRNLWSVIGLTIANYRKVIEDTVSRGFTTIEVWIPAHFSGSVNLPMDGAGNLPFSKRLDGSAWSGTFSYSNINNEAPDFTQLNEAYWAFVDVFLGYCEEKGLLVQVFFAYVGFNNGAGEGWMDEMVANGATKMQAYGAALATRYQNQKNLVWMIGGDRGLGAFPFDAGQAAVEQAFINGLQGVTRVSNLMAAEWVRGSSGSIATDQTDFGQYVTLNSTYASATGINLQGSLALAHSPQLPAYLMEAPFDDGSVKARQYCWWGQLANVGGYQIGDFNLYLFGSGYLTALTNATSQQLVYLHRFFRAIQWNDLIPTPAAITAGGSTISASDYVACAVDAAGSTLVAYVPPSHSGTFAVDMTKMRGTTTALWYDPTTGLYTSAGSGLANTGTRVFTISANSLGDNDQVLKLVA